MKKIEKKDIWLLIAHVALLSLILLSPGLISYITTGNPGLAWESLWIACFWLAPTIGIYLINFYLLIPLMWTPRRYWLYGSVNALLVVFGNTHLILNDTSLMPDTFRAGYLSFIIISIILNLMAIGIALSVRYMLRQQESRQKEVEAELAWLKSQINPHFLFNTLNNISSLTQIDSDEAQDAILQLSDLLRYAMYETNKPKVPIGGEVEFMKNYIELMKLRCNKNTQVHSQFSILHSQLEIAPLLFISLIENAFKHGMNGNQPATISISLTQEGNRVSFTCDNTNNPKPTKDRSGSGIGLDNTRRRLNLLYAGRHKWEQSITPENIYHVKIVLEIKE